MEEIKLRAMQPNDMSFIYSTFLRGLYYGCAHFKEMKKDAFFVAQETTLLRLMAKPVCNVVIACLSSEPDIILGWTLIEPKNAVLHFIYVKDAWRSKGVAKQMVGLAKISSVTHITKIGNEIRKRKQWDFNPWLV